MKYQSFFVFGLIGVLLQLWSCDQSSKPNSPVLEGDKTSGRTNLVLQQVLKIFGMESNLSNINSLLLATNGVHSPSSIYLFKVKEPGICEYFLLEYVLSDLNGNDSVTLIPVFREDGQAFNLTVLKKVEGDTARPDCEKIMDCLTTQVILGQFLTTVPPRYIFDERSLSLYAANRGKYRRIEIQENELSNPSNLEYRSIVEIVSYIGNQIIMSQSKPKSQL
jgi:hypothetical protein